MQIARTESSVIRAMVGYSSSLIGWYRHCGLIPYTQDVDFGLFAEEYDERIRQHFLGHPTVYLWGALGLVGDRSPALEFIDRFR